jgi:hypothetical protein
MIATILHIATADFHAAIIAVLCVVLPGGLRLCVRDHTLESMSRIFMRKTATHVNFRPFHTAGVVTRSAWHLGPV